jgi:hypothetical protein
MQKTSIISEKIIKTKFKEISFCLNERSRRIWAAAEAKNYGWGGISIVSRAIKIDQKTIKSGIFEIENDDKLKGDCIRKPGGGRKKITVDNPDIIKKLEVLIEPATRGDPESPLRWTSKSTYKLAEELTEKESKVSQRTVCSLLKNELGYSLQANRKTNEGGNHPDRDSQFNFINKKTKRFQKNKCPVISVDTKKKENIGNFKNNGKEYHKKGEPAKVNIYDFIDQEKGKVSPYGIYDFDKNKGWVNVGISSDTAEFAVESIRTWWCEMGKQIYQKAEEILITADCGGSNGYRVRLWKVELQKLATEINKTISVSHFPPGTSKWNKIEHKLFCFISKNWRGKPLVDRATVVNLIGSVKTKTGLIVKARLDENHYEKGIKVTDEELAAVNLKRDKFHGEWNYKISPNKSS